MLDKMKQVYQLQKQARELQAELKKTEIEAKSANGLISVVLTGEMKVQSITIDPSLMVVDQKRQVEQGLVDALREGISQAERYRAEKSQAMMKEMGIDIPGM